MRKFLPVFLVFSLVGCVTIPIDILRMPPDSLEKRQLQTRKYETTDEEKMISASAGVLQDLGFTLDESESKLGLLVASKDRDATDAGQVVLATTVVALSALAGTYSNALDLVDATQKIRASVVTRLTLDGKGIFVRVTFQRVIWNRVGAVSRMETLSEPEMYTGFFDKLSKSVFLEEHKI